MINLNKYLPSRDSLFWTLSMVGSIAVGMTASFSQFPWIPVSWQHAITLIAFIYGIASGKLATSPLNGSK